MMKRIGTLLISLGAVVGVASGVAVAMGARPFGVAWLVGVALVKLALAASLGLMAAGAILVRASRRKAREREALGAGDQLGDLKRSPEAVEERRR